MFARRVQRSRAQEGQVMVVVSGSLQMFLLKADRLVRCRWYGRSEQVEVIGRALDGETVRQITRDAADAKKYMRRL